MLRCGLVDVERLRIVLRRKGDDLFPVDALAADLLDLADLEIFPVPDCQLVHQNKFATKDTDTRCGKRFSDSYQDCVAALSARLLRLPSW